jgi:homoserine kinase
MRVRVPASSANLGPGFDALGVALSLYLEVSVTPADAFSITTSGFGAGAFDSPDHLGAVVARRVLGHDRFAMHVHSDIPLSRGLGSSASLALAAAAAAGSGDPLGEAIIVDGHAENAAASLRGGLVIATTNDTDGAVVRDLVLDPAWRFVAVVPDQELATADARRVLPTSVPYHDAVANVGAVGLLIAGLAKHTDFVAAAMDDYLHQPYRMDLLPFARPLLALLREAGAAGSCWSGAGSTMLALVTDQTAQAVATAATAFLADNGVAGVVHVLDADRRGLVVVDE